MDKNIDNNKNMQWKNIEKNDSNWFKRQWESVKGFFGIQKSIDELGVKEEIISKTEKIKDTTIDSTLDNLNLDMQEWLNLKESDSETKEELNQFFKAWKEELKNDIEQPWEAKLREKLFESNRFGKRSPEIVTQIAKSATKIENEIQNWEKEPNLIAKWLLNVVDRIMKTEK